MIKTRVKQTIDRCFAQGVEQGLWSRQAEGRYTVEVPKREEQGDFSTNFAMVAAKADRCTPREIAARLVDLLAADGEPVHVTGRGLFSATPARLAGRYAGALDWWAGPWPVDERWWDPERGKGRTARAQVLLGDEGESRALLLCYRQRRWYVEGIYE